MGSQAISEAGVLKANLRFTQSKAMSDLPGNIWSLNITASDYTIQQNGGVPNPAVNLPGSDSSTYTLPNGQTITAGTGSDPIQFPGAAGRCLRKPPGGQCYHHSQWGPPGHRHPGDGICAMRKRRLNQTPGFTLIELVITITLAGIVMMMITPLLPIRHHHQPPAGPAAPGRGGPSTGHGKHERGLWKNPQDHCGPASPFQHYRSGRVFV